MRQILAPSKTAIRLCGEQRYDPDQQYRWTKHCVSADCADGTLLYHTMTCEMVLLEGEHAEDCREALVRGWFLVPQNYDENKQVRDMRRIGAMILPKQTEKTSFTILTTTDCNARCFYCYEMGCSRTSMTDETATAATDYIARVSGGKDVTLHWFGGEPLYHQKPIEIITEGLRARGIRFTSSMTSNGYYLDRETAQKAARDWNLKTVQITLDGTREIYQRTKAFIERDEHAFDRVLDHIGYTLDAGIAVNVRLNLDDRNAEDLFALADILAKRPGPRPGFGVYTALLQQFRGPVNEFASIERAANVAIALEEKLERLGIRHRKPLYRNFQMMRCMADNDAVEEILPDGRLTKCEHFDENDTYGSIFDTARDAAFLQSWKEWSYFPECEACESYPLCFNLKRCEWLANGCQRASHLQILRNMKREMQLVYQERKAEETK